MILCFFWQTNSLRFMNASSMLNLVLLTIIYVTFLQKVRVQETKATTTTVTTPTTRTTHRRPVTTAAAAPLHPGTRSAPAPGRRTGVMRPRTAGPDAIPPRENTPSTTAARAAEPGTRLHHTEDLETGEEK